MTRRSQSPAGRLHDLVSQTRRAGRSLLLVGIGNEMLGDDGVGCRVAHELAGLEDRGLTAVAAGIAVENVGRLIERCRPAVLLLVDAATGLGRRPWSFVPLSRVDSFCHSTHAVPLPLLVSTWQRETPGLATRFIGLAMASAALGAELSPGVAAAHAEIVATIRQALADPLS